jgi:hypothetical protein
MSQDKVIGSLRETGHRSFKIINSNWESNAAHRKT